MTVPNQSSAFVSLKLDNGVGLQPDGTEVRNFAPQSGRLVVVGEEPLLEAVRTGNRRGALILYGPPGFSYEIQTRTRLISPPGWQPLMQVTLTNLFQIFSGIDLSGPSRFYRAVRVSRTGPRLSIRDMGGAVVIEWPVECAGCVLEESREIGPRASWSSTSAPAQISGGRYQVTVPHDGPSRYYRLRSP
jgi:hypothetical protein